MSRLDCGTVYPDRRGDVAIPGGRRLHLECRGAGSPTVVLEAGTGDRGDVWSAAPSGPGQAVLPAVARLTRVCAYDRPGTYASAQELSRSDPVAMPRSARDIVRDLRALLRAARVPGPYVLAGHSFGGMVARLYATTWPHSAIERLSLEVSAAQMRQAQADTPLRPMPLVVLSHSRTLPNPFGLPSDWPVEALERAFQDSQDELAALVPGARHVTAARSGHYIQLDQPRLVTREIRRVVRAARAGR